MQRGHAQSAVSSLGSIVAVAFVVVAVVDVAAAVVVVSVSLVVVELWTLAMFAGAGTS